MSRPTPEAEQLKAHGNAMYQRGKYGAAIDAYTEAITLCPRWLPLVLNRALCHRKRKNWAAVKEDCVKALDIDRESIKANYMLGLSLIAERRFTEVRLARPARAPIPRPRSHVSRGSPRRVPTSSTLPTRPDRTETTARALPTPSSALDAHERPAHAPASRRRLSVD